MSRTTLTILYYCTLGFVEKCSSVQYKPEVLVSLQWKINFKYLENEGSGFNFKIELKSLENCRN
jgi:hypothetical protein